MTDQTENQVPAKPYNILKTCDDRQPVRLNCPEDGRFALAEGSSASWVRQGHEVTLSDIRARVEPWLTSLFQSEHLSLLAGSGLTTAIHVLAVGRPATGMNGTIGDETLDSSLSAAAAVAARNSGRADGNIEDKIRVANELLRAHELLGNQGEGAKIIDALRLFFEDFSRSILHSEMTIASAGDENGPKALGTLVSFLTSFASRTGTRDRLHVFTTNYDRLIEAGAELAGIHLLDRFVGTLTPIFRSSRLDLDMHYNPPGIRGEPRYLEGVARFTKLHGSLDWVQVGDLIRRIGVPFGADSILPYLNAPGLEEDDTRRLMIYPNAAKDQETAGFPYVELFRDLAAAICRPNSTLVTYGYGFGDEHINRVIRDMLTIPSTHVVIISYDDPMQRMQRLAEQRPAQVTLLVGRDLANIETLTRHFLPKPAIDRATFRMSELLKHRFGIQNVGGAAVNVIDDARDVGSGGGTP